VLTQPITERSGRLEGDLEARTYIVCMEDQLHRCTRGEVMRGGREDLGAPEDYCPDVRLGIVDHRHKDPCSDLQRLHQSRGVSVRSEGEVKTDFGIAVLSPRSEK